MSSFDLDEFARRFVACEITRPEWTHFAHLAIGAWHVDRFGADDALVRLRHGIRRLNESNRVVNSATSGYHETITRAYVVLIDQYLRASSPDTPLVERVMTLSNGPLGERDVLFTYYSRPRLMSELARREWVEPDLQPLDW